MGTENQEVEHVYRTWSEHCSVILRETSKVKSNWLFILNGGAITAILAIERIFLYKYIQYPIIIYFMGIVSNYISLEVEFCKFRTWFVGWIEKDGKIISFINHIADDKMHDISVRERVKDDSKSRLLAYINAKLAIGDLHVDF